MTKTLAHLATAAYLAAGIYLLIILFPRDSPWALSFLARGGLDDPRHFMAYLPFFPSGIRVSVEAIVLSAVALGLLVILAIPRKHFLSAWRSLRSHPKAFLGGMIALQFFLITLVPAEPDLVRDGSTVVFSLVTGLIAFLLVAIGIAPVIPFLTSSERIARVTVRIYETLKRSFLTASPLIIIGSLAVIHFILTNIFSLCLFEHIPHVQDSSAQLFHGKIFTHGVLTAPAPRYPQFFEFTHMILRDEKWYSQYPPGHSILLAAGVLIGAPWIINPLFGTATLILMYLLGKELHGEIVGRLSALLTLLSPFLVFMSSEFMNHTTALFFFLVFLLFLAKSLKSGRFLHGSIAGLGLGWLLNIRPYSAAALGAPFLLYAAVVGFRRFRELRPAIVGFCLAGGFFAGALLLFNTLTNGHPFVFGFHALWGDQVNPGFGTGAWGKPHTAMRGLLQTLSNFNGVNKYLFELPIPSLLLVVLLFFTGTRDRWDLLFVAAFLLLAVAYFFYWFQDWCFGPRFLFEGSALFIVLTARAIERLPVLWNEILGLPGSRKAIRIATGVTLVVLFVVGYAQNLPPHIDYYGSSYWGVNGDVLRAVEERGITRAVVFSRSYYGSVFPANDPFLQGDVIYAHDLDDKNSFLMSLYPGYSFYRAKGSEIIPIPRISLPVAGGVPSDPTATTPSTPSHRLSR